VHLLLSEQYIDSTTDGATIKVTTIPVDKKKIYNIWKYQEIYPVRSPCYRKRWRKGGDL